MPGAGSSEWSTAGGGVTENGQLSVFGVVGATVVVGVAASARVGAPERVSPTPTAMRRRTLLRTC